MSNSTLYYSDKKDKAVELTREMIADGWSDDDLMKYWACLGYDIFFWRGVIKAAKQPSA